MPSIQLLTTQIGSRKSVLKKILSAGRSSVLGLLALTATQVPTAYAKSALAADAHFESAFDRALGTRVREPKVDFSSFEYQVAALANQDRGRIGVAAVDLQTGRSIGVLQNQAFPMASTSKIAIVATFLDGVDRGRFKLTDEYPLMVAVPSVRLSSSVAPVRPGTMMSARALIEATITRSSNPATDALLAVVGGPRAVNNWLRRSGIEGMQIDRDIATLVRDDGAVDPVRTVDTRDSSTPDAMIRLLTGLHQGQWLSKSSRDVLLGSMSRTVTGKRRIKALLPADTRVSHKTGSLYNTSSDVGYIETADGRKFAVAIYVTGQGTRLERENRIANIALGLHNGYLQEGSSRRLAAARR